MTQTTFRHLVEDAHDKVNEPHFKEYLKEIAETAKRHEEKAEELYRVIGREPAIGRKLIGTVMSKARQAFANLQDAAGGAVGGFREVRQLLIANVDSMDAFVAAEQIGLALGLPEIVDITFPVENEKSAHQLLLQEILLEMAAQSILYKTAV
jgi:flagellar motor component MotA